MHKCLREEETPIPTPVEEKRYFITLRIWFQQTGVSYFHSHNGKFLVLILMGFITRVNKCKIIDKVN